MVEINYDARWMYNTNSQINFITTMLKSSLCDYGDTYILVKGNITIIRRPVIGDSEVRLTKQRN